MSLFRRSLTQRQLAALVLIRTMAAQAAGGESTFAARIMVMVARRQWEALAAVASLLSDAATAPSPGDFRAVGSMSPRLQSAYLDQALVDLGGAGFGNRWGQRVVDFDVWDKIADAVRRAVHALGS